MIVSTIWPIKKPFAPHYLDNIEGCHLLLELYFPFTNNATARKAAMQTFGIVLYDIGIHLIRRQIITDIMQRVRQILSVFISYLSFCFFNL